MSILCLIAKLMNGFLDVMLYFLDEYLVFIDEIICFSSIFKDDEDKIIFVL